MVTMVKTPLRQFDIAIHSANSELVQVSNMSSDGEKSPAIKHRAQLSYTAVTVYLEFGNWKPMSETFAKFREKFPLQFDDKAGLIHRTERLNYIKSSQPKLAQEVKIPLKRYGSSDETRSIAEPAESLRFGQLCNKSVDRPKGVIYTNAKGFARLVDPYLTTTMKDIVPHVKHQHDTVTFWNWAEREERKRIPQATEPLQPRMVIPVFKRKLNHGFVSEMKGNFVKPVELEFRLDPTITRPIVLDPTDHTETATESSTYGGTKNCAMIQKQRRYE